MSRNEIEWETSKEQRTENLIRHEFKPFYFALCKEIARHVPEKGFGYRNAEWLDYFKEEASKLATRYACGYEENIDESLDISAFMAFSWMHEHGKFDFSEERVKLGGSP